MATAPAATCENLTISERTVLEYVERAAEQNRELEPNDEIGDALGFSGTGTVRGIILRLERKGYVKVRSYQRGRAVFAVRINKWTRPPLCLVPHWRTIAQKSYKETPTQPPQRLMQVPTVMEAVDSLMKERAMTMQEAQVTLMAYGVSMLAAERAQNMQRETF